MKSRLNRIRGLLEQLNADGILIWKLANVRYLAGFTGTEGTCLIDAGHALFLTDSRYIEQAKIQVVPNGFEVVQVRDKVKDLGAKVQELGWKAAAFEDETLTVAQHQQLSRAVGKTRLVPAGSAVEKLRIIKDEQELASIREAIRVQEEAMEAVMPRIVAGAAEDAIAFQMEMEMRKRGASGVSFETIVGSGPRGAMPHGVASNKKIKAGELVVLDWGCIVNGYCSDQTLTVCVGKPADRDAKKVYKVVGQAQAAAIAAVRPGVNLSLVDKVARDIINDAGYGATFGHGTGHCLGLEIHEEPRINQLSTAQAEVGMVFTVEPGIYLAGRFGVRLEDIVLVTETGAQKLTSMAKTWRSTV